MEDFYSSPASQRGARVMVQGIDNETRVRGAHEVGVSVCVRVQVVRVREQM